jgi:hypothetical protein
MLPVPGPLPINPVQKPDEGNLFLRVNQKVAGEILQVSNEQVVLSIQGVQVVARLTTPEQMTELIDRRFAQFVVKEFNPNAVLLQLVDTNQASKPVAQSIGQQETLVVQQLLQRMNIKADPASMLIAQELINQGVAISQETISELQTALKEIPGWGSREANLAVQIKSFGVPVTPQTIELMGKAPSELTRVLGQLGTELQQLATDVRLPNSLRTQIETAMRILNQGIVQADQPIADLVQNLKNAITLLGKSVEHELVQANPQSELEQGLIVLNQLRNQMAQRGNLSVARDIDQLNDYLRLIHLPNSNSNNPKIQNEWIRVEIPVHFPIQTNPPRDEDLVPARLRIARENQDENGKIDPNYTRVVLQMEISTDQMMEVDLSVVSRKIGLNITAPDEFTREAALEELDQLISDFSELGFETRYSHIDTGAIVASDGADSLSNLTHNAGSVNLKV